MGIWGGGYLGERGCGGGRGRWRDEEEGWAPEKGRGKREGLGEMGSGVQEEEESGDGVMRECGRRGTTKEEGGRGNEQLRDVDYVWGTKKSLGREHVGGGVGDGRGAD